MKLSHILALACAVAATGESAAEADLDSIRAATARFKDVKVALAEGYMAPPGGTCETAAGMGLDPRLGGMGVHYFRPDLLGITGVEPRVNGIGTHTDFTKPAILIYEPNAQGEMELVAVENLVFEKAWKAAGNSAPPTFAGRTWDHMVDDPATPADEAHMFEPHYDQHIWLYRDNPNGMFAQFNPNVTCKFGPVSHHAHQDHGSHSGHEGAASGR